MSSSILGKRKHYEEDSSSDYVPLSKRRETRRKELMESSTSLGSKREIARAKKKQNVLKQIWLVKKQYHL